MILFTLTVYLDYQILPNKLVNLCTEGMAEYRKCFIGDSHCISSALVDLQYRHMVEPQPGYRNQTLTGKYIFNSFNEMYFIYHKIIQLKCKVLQCIFRTLQPSPQSNFRIFSTSQKETSYTLIVISVLLSISSTPYSSPSNH